MTNTDDAQSRKEQNKNTNTNTNTAPSPGTLPTMSAGEPIGAGTRTKVARIRELNDRLRTTSRGVPRAAIPSVITTMPHPARPGYSRCVCRMVAARAEARKSVFQGGVPGGLRCPAIFSPRAVHPAFGNARRV